MNPTIGKRIRPAAMVLAACVLWVSAPAMAQVCREGSASGTSALPCDMDYRDGKLSCTETYTAEDKDGREVTLPSLFPACPAEPMPMRDTPRLSFIRDFSPYLYDYVRDPEDASKPYAGFIVRGTVGDASQVFATIGAAPEGVTRQKGCVNQIEIEGITDPKERAKLIRLQLDNCANQFILNTAMYPFHKAGSNMICATEDDPTRRCAQEDMCQPMRMTEDPKQEYLASTYIEAAWKKLLNDPAYRLRDGKAPKEPGLPQNLTLVQPIATPTIPEVRLNALAATPYEEIIDPSHPFSPRWDFQWNEREHYSPKTNTYMSKYHDNAKAVYCAGNRAETGGDADKDYRVDVLEFRREKFDKGMTNRINYNTNCYNDNKTNKVQMMLPPYVGAPTPQFLSMTADAYCYKVTRPPIPATPTTPGYPGDAERMPCWACYGLSGKIDDSGSNLPPCATRYDSRDQKIITKSGSYPVYPGGKNAFKREAVCMVNPLDSKTSINTLCKDLRAPLTPVNKLKMRYHDPEGPESEIVLKEGAQEGLSFNDYFYNPETKVGHMPYMRQWDTGRSIQKSVSTDQDPLDVYGQHTVIVGVGREAKPDNSSTDQRCLYGGWGDSTSIGSLRINVPDPITSWTELKLYQAYTTRETGIVCIGRYEKAFKHRSSENQMLTAAGAVRTGIVRTECDVDDNGRTIASTCVSREVSEGEETPAGGVTTGKKWHSLQYTQDALPLAWRGYLSAKDTSKGFPALAGSGGLVTGLDNAQCGDFILMPDGGGTGSATTRGLPKLARVRCSSGERKEGALSAVKTIEGELHFVEVEEADNGKWPDVCGTTNMVGELKTRRLFKPGEMRPNIKRTLEQLNWTTSCEDTQLSECEMKPWSSLKLYRPVSNVLNGNDGEATSGTP